MGQCQQCGGESHTISSRLGYCAACIRGHFDQVWPTIQDLHRQSRQFFNLRAQEILVDDRQLFSSASFETSTTLRAPSMSAHLLSVFDE